MNVLIIGDGGRENAIAWSVYASPLLGKLFCMPGNPGIADYAICIDGNILDNNEVYKCILEYSIDVVIVGPEKPLVNGIVDFLENKNIKVFGPSFSAAKLEGSKIFAREFCKKYSIPQPNFQSFSNIIKGSVNSCVLALPAIDVTLNKVNLSADAGSPSNKSTVIVVSLALSLLTNNDFTIALVLEGTVYKVVAVAAVKSFFALKYIFAILS